MNSMAIVFQLILRCYQDPIVGKKTLVTAATYTRKALKDYLEQVKRLQRYVDSLFRLIVMSSISCIGAIHLSLKQLLC